MAWVKDEIDRAVGLPRVIGGIPLDEIGATGLGVFAHSVGLVLRPANQAGGSNLFRCRADHSAEPVLRLGRPKLVSVISGLFWRFGDCAGDNPAPVQQAA